MTFPAYPAYKESGVKWLGEVPQHWPIYSLKRTVDGCVNGLWGDEPDGENDIAVIRVADFERSFSTVGLDKLTYRSITPKEKQSRLIKSGDLLIEKSGGGEKTLVGCVVLFSHEFEAITSNFVARMRPLSEFDSQFLCYAFGNLYHGRVNYPSVKQVTGIQNLDAESYLQERFCFPSRVEQTQIARFLDHETARIDALIEEQQRLIELLKEKRQAVISHAVTKGLDPTVPMKDSGVEWLGEVPAHWDVLRIGAVYSETADKGLPELPVLRVSIHYGVSDKELSEEESDRKITRIDDREKYKRVRPGDLVYNMMRAWQGGFGAVLVDGLVSPAYVVARPKNGDISRYVEQLLRTSCAIEEMRKNSYGITDFRLRLYWDQFKNIFIVIPPEVERQQIMERIDSLIDESEALKNEADRLIVILQERRSALISAAVTGKIDVRGWQPPASTQSPESAVAEAV